MLKEDAHKACRNCKLTLVPDPELSNNRNIVWIHEDGHAILCRGPKEAQHAGHPAHPGHHA